MINFSIHITGICNLGLVKNEKKLKFMLNLYVIRHGKAVRPEDAVNDFSRELNKKGTAQGRLPPKMDEQPVALATTMRSPKSWVSSLR